jgi:hypothetical protein
MVRRHVVGGLALGFVGLSAVGCGDESAAPSTTADRIASVTTVLTTAPPPRATASPATTAPVETPDTISSQVVGGAGYGDGYGYGGYDYLGEPLPEVASRTTADGIVVHVQQMPDWNQANVGASVNWSPAPWCTPQGTLRVTMRLGEAVGVGQGARYLEPYGGVSATTLVAGYAEGTPFTVLVLQVDPAITEVTAQFADGSTDSTQPVDGYAVLAAPSAQAADVAMVGGPPTVGLSVTRNGETISFDPGNLPHPSEVEYQDACNPPTTLPAPGEQPADPVAAEQAVRDVFGAAFADDGSAGWTSNLDNTDGIQDALDQIMSGPYKDAAGSADHTMNDLVFTSPTEAWFTYDLFANNNNFDDRFGVAYLIDGQWKISRNVMCQDLALAGVNCVPEAGQLYPPQS